jgi:transposase
LGVEGKRLLMSSFSKTPLRKEKQMTTSAAGSKDSTGSLYVAFELSSGTWKLAFTVGRGQRPRVKGIRAGDVKAVVREIRAAKKRFGLAEGCRVLSCYEAGRDGFWVHRFLTSTGVENLVVDSASIEVSRRRRRAKTDRLDAEKLVMMLVRWDEGEKKVWGVVRVPSVEAEDARCLHRELRVLKGERTKIVNRIKGLLAVQGVRLKSTGRGFREWLGQVRLWDGSALPRRLGQQVLVEYDRLCFVRAQITAVEQERRRLLKESQKRDAAVARKLMRLRGVGEGSGWTFSSELFSWREFSNRKQVGSSAGLTGTPYDSGSSGREQGIDKAGNKRIRAVAIELAWCWLRYQPESALSRWYEERFGSGGKRMRKIGIVALARKLLIALWRWVEQDVIPEGAVLKA